jgi:hypothetical protein
VFVPFFVPFRKPLLFKVTIKKQKKLVRTCKMAIELTMEMYDDGSWRIPLPRVLKQLDSSGRGRPRESRAEFLETVVRPHFRPGMMRKELAERLYPANGHKTQQLSQRLSTHGIKGMQELEELLYPKSSHVTYASSPPPTKPPPMIRKPRKRKTKTPI